MGNARASLRERPPIFISEGNFARAQDASSTPRFSTAPPSWILRSWISPQTIADVHARGETLNVADRFQLTAYEAAYLELAQRRTVPLATIYPPTARRNS